MLLAPDTVMDRTAKSRDTQRLTPRTKTGREEERRVGAPYLSVVRTIERRAFPRSRGLEPTPDPSHGNKADPKETEGLLLGQPQAH